MVHRLISKVELYEGRFSSQNVSFICKFSIRDPKKWQQGKYVKISFIFNECLTIRPVNIFIIVIYNNYRIILRKIIQQCMIKTNPIKIALLLYRIQICGIIIFFQKILLWINKQNNYNNNDRFTLLPALLCIFFYIVSSPLEAKRSTSSFLFKLISNQKLT